MSEEGAPVSVNEPISGSADIQAIAPVATTPDAGDHPVLSIAPESYKQEKWVQEIPDTDTLFKMLSDQKAALSRRPGGIPQDNAPDEEWKAFNKSLGVPETPQEYSFDREGVEFTDAQKAFQDGLRPVLHKANITPKQLEQLAPAWDEFVEAQNAEQAKAADAEFDQLSSVIFPNEAEKQAAFDKTKDLWKKYAPEEFQNHMQEMDNRSLLGLSLIVKGFMKDYVSEDSLPGQADTMGAASSQAEIRAEIGKLMAEDGFFKPHSPNHAALRAKSMELHKKLAAM